MGRSEALQIAQTLRRNESYKETLILALAGEDEPAPEGLSEFGFSDAFKKPFDIALLSERHPHPGGREARRVSGRQDEQERSEASPPPACSPALDLLLLPAKRGDKILCMPPPAGAALGERQGDRRRRAGPLAKW